MDPGDEINACASPAKRGLVGNPLGRVAAAGGSVRDKSETPLYFCRHMVLLDRCTPVTIYLSLSFSSRPQLAKRVVFRETLSDRAVSL